MIEPIAITKFQIPPLRQQLVRRSRLIDRLNAEVKQHKLTLVSAPAGSGKTTLLGDWARQSRMAVVWISLDASDNDPNRFLSCLIVGCKNLQATSDTPQKVTTQLHNRPDGIKTEDRFSKSLELIVVNLINDLAAVAQPEMPQIVILDDYHMIQSSAIHHAVDFLVEYLPPHVHLVIATRTDPPLGLARLRARGQIHELRADDLRFSPIETTAFLKSMVGPTLSAKEIQTLETATEGWIAGLQLAAYMLRDTDERPDIVNLLSGRHQLIFDYLAEEVLFCQPESIQAFLLETSILDLLNGGLCNAVTGRSDSQEVLEGLVGANLFIVPLDNERTWYRYHHLFIDMLRFRLRRTLEGRVPELHQRASTWYAHNGLVYEALAHAFASSDYERARQLIEDTDSSLTLRGGVKMLTYWLNKLPDRIVRASPRLSIIYAWALLLTLDIDYLEARLNDAMRALGISDSNLSAIPTDLPPRDEALIGEITALSVYVTACRGHLDDAVRIAQAGLQRENLHPQTRGLIAEILGDAYRDAGKASAAQQAYQDSIRFAHQAENPLAVSISQDEIAWVHLMTGDLHQSKADFEAILQTYDWQPQPLLAVAKTYVGLGLIYREWNDLDRAERYLLEGASQCELGGYLRYTITALIGLAHVKLVRRDAKEAVHLASKAVQIAQGTSLGWVLSNALAFRAALWLHPTINNLTAALTWAEQCPLTLADTPVYLHQIEYLTLVRVRLATDSASANAALPLLAALAQQAADDGRHLDVIKIRLLQARIHQTTGQTAVAHALIKQTLALAQAEGYRRVFLDEGAPLRDLLNGYSPPTILRLYVADLLSAFANELPPPQTLTAPAPLSEPLTPRELEVLQLLAHGLSNREIGAKLHISMGTINTHTRQLFRKLNAHNRIQTLANARALGLLP